MKNSLRKITLTLLMFTTVESFARGPEINKIAICDSAVIGSLSSTEQVVYLDKSVIQSLLTRNTDQLVNREYLLGSNAEMGISPTVDLNKDINLAVAIVAQIGVYTHTNEGADSYGNYSGSMGQRGSKQVQVVLNKQQGELLIRLFDVSNGQEDAKLILKGCRAPSL